MLNSPKYSTLKKIPDEYASLRQTFDYKNNSKLQSKLADYNFESDKDSKCADTMLRQTFHTRKTTNFLTENSLCASVAYKTTFPCEQN